MSFRLLLIVVLLGMVRIASAQDYAQIDRYARQTPDRVTTDIKKLVDHLVAPYDTDMEKVRSIFSWIAYNISYDKSAYKKGNKRINRSNTDILQRREAVCFGYSTLFVEMCELAAISAVVVDGYPKNMETGNIRLEEVNHAWNAVKVDSSWHLLDITWASDFGQRDLNLYFLPRPEEMILTHLPADPMWQLLPCPVPAETFQKATHHIRSYLDSTTACFAYRDSINNYLSLPRIDQVVQQYANAYRFHPIAPNKSALGHAYMDQVATLIDQVDRLEREGAIDSVKMVHRRIIELCNTAQSYIDLYDYQKENLAYSHINYAVAISRTLPETQDEQDLLRTMKTHFATARALLESLPKTYVIEQSLQQLSAYQEWVESY